MSTTFFLFSRGKASPPVRRSRLRNGFSLIELMVVVAVIGILASIAYPSYSQYTVRASRSAAQQFLLKLAGMQEQYLLDSRRYADTLDKLIKSEPRVPTEVSDYYATAISVNNTATPPYYLLTATPITGTRQEGDPVLTLDSAGLQKPAEYW